MYSFPVRLNHKLTPCGPLQSTIKTGLGFKLFDVTTPNRPANTAPVIQDASALPEPVRPGETLNLQVNARMPMATHLFYRWTQTAGAMLTVSNADKAMAQVQIPPDLANQTPHLPSRGVG